VLRSVGPVWNGNEVWLVSAGGTLFFAFPALYASSFSGFYLPLMIVLWLLMLRGIAIAFRGHLDNAAWTPFWDIVFGFSSLLLVLFLGAALGNVVRGVPLDGQGNFLEPLWTNFRLGPQPGVIDWYTTLTGVAAVFALTQHGALWVALKTEGAVNARARSIGRPTWWAVTVITIVLTAVTFHVQPQIPASLAARPWTYVCPALAVAGQIAVWRSLPSGDELRAFLGSCAYLLGMMTSVVFGLYPVVLPASTNPAPALTIYNATMACGWGSRGGCPA